MTGDLYTVYGLTIAMPFACEELAHAPPGSVPDVVVSEGSVPLSILEPQLSDPDLEMSSGVFLLRTAKAGARFLVEGGRRVTFERLSGARDAILRHVLLHQVMAALLRQRGMLVLHASGAISPSGIILVGGESGAGKSTTVAALTKCGWPLQTDDVSALFMTGEGVVEVVPGGRDLHLFETSSAALSLDATGILPNAWHRMKLALPALVEPIRRSRPLRRIVYLERCDDGPLRVERVNGQAKLPLLLKSLYGPYLAEQLAAERVLISMALSRIEMIRIVRPNGAWTIDEVVTAITGA